MGISIAEHGLLSAVKTIGAGHVAIGTGGFYQDACQGFHRHILIFSLLLEAFEEGLEFKQKPFALGRAV